MSLDRHFPELQYLRHFQAHLFNIVIIVSFLLLFLLLHFL